MIQFRNNSRLIAGLICTAILCAFVSEASAVTLVVASPFTDHAVLQRDRDMVVWGQAESNAEVTITFNGAKATVKAAADGNWRATLPPMPAGGPYQMGVAAGEAKLEISDLLVGDVWLCSGQSNMQMSLKEVANAPAEIATAATHANFRLLKIGKAGAEKPNARFDGKWQPCTPTSAADFSAVSYLFAHELAQSPKLKNVPIGLIDSSFGGTAVEGWIPENSLRDFKKDDLSDSMFGIRGSALYNAMIAPLAPYPIAGVVWYQGESNASHPQPYAKLLTTLVTSWRAEFGSPALPFLIVQLPPNSGRWNGYYFTWIRDAQDRVGRAVAGVAVATTVNTTDGTDLHPREKHEIGTRLALLARRDVFHEGIVSRGPVYKSATVEGDKVRLTFDTQGSTLKGPKHGSLKSFLVAGEDGKYHFAEATIDGNTVLVSSAAVPNPKTVRYGWSAVPAIDLCNAQDLPAAPFRTDDFPVSQLLEVQPLPPARRIETATYECTVDAGGKVTSLAVKGKQFISNAIGGAGGTSMPMGFGFKELMPVHAGAPNLLSFADGGTSLGFTFEASTLTWKINQQANDINFRLALSPLVQVKPGSSGTDSTTLVLSRGEARLTVEGFTIINQTEEGGKLLEVKVPANGSAVLRFTIGE